MESELYFIACTKDIACDFIPYAEINPKCIIDLKINARPIKILKESLCNCTVGTGGNGVLPVCDVEQQGGLPPTGNRTCQLPYVVLLSVTGGEPWGQQRGREALPKRIKGVC